jgi:hypothetical protein
LKRHQSPRNKLFFLRTDHLLTHRKSFPSLVAIQKNHCHHEKSHGKHTHKKTRTKKRSVVDSSTKIPGKSKELKTSHRKKSKNVVAGIGVVSCSPLSCNNMTLKSRCSNKSKKSLPQLRSNVVSNVAKKLAFTEKHKVHRSPNSNSTKKKTKPSVAAAAMKGTFVKSMKKKTKSSAAAAATKVTSVKSSTKMKSNQMHISGATTKSKIIKTQKQAQMSTAANSRIVSGDKQPSNKLNAYKIDWIDSKVRTMETMKYSKAEKIDRTQGSMITFLVNQFKPSDIKVAFATLIGRAGNSAQTAFYPLPAQKAKLVESFLELVYDERSMMVDTVKKPFR